jgi:hypothetical protein
MATTLTGGMRATQCRTPRKTGCNPRIIHSLLPRDPAFKSDNSPGLDPRAAADLLLSSRGRGRRPTATGIVCQRTSSSPSAHAYISRSKGSKHQLAIPTAGDLPSPSKGNIYIALVSVYSPVHRQYRASMVLVSLHRFTSAANLLNG